VARPAKAACVNKSPAVTTPVIIFEIMISSLKYYTQ